MPGPNANSVRRPAVAGIFYPADETECRRKAASYLEQPLDVESGDTRAKWIGGIVPHAGWVCSGEVAGQTIATMARGQTVDVVVVFGAVHTPLALRGAALSSHSRWLVPGGESTVALELEQRLLEEAGDRFRVDDRFHQQEHAVEVELPLIQLAWPTAMVLPVEVPTIDAAVEMGKLVAGQLQAAGLSAAFLASSDLTHYGSNYGFAPGGPGLAGLEWSRANDRRLLDLVASFEVEQIVPEVNDRLNACGGGAIAAMMAAAREFGATSAKVLRHTNSYETLAAVSPQSPTNTVGYAAVVVG